MNADQTSREQARQITSELTRLLRTGKIMPGSIQQRHTFCGRQGCACQADPPRPHGPYWQWTRKVAGKTVTRRLNAQQIERYRPWIENDHRIRELLSALETIGIAHLEAERRHS
jgi:uncharacterized protein DUF6788